MPHPFPEPREGEPIGRRVFVRTLLVGGVSLVVGDRLFDLAAGVSSPVTDQIPQEIRAALPAPGGGWRIYAVNPPMPRFDPRTWSLEVSGLVRRPMRIGYRELRAMPRSEQTHDFHCVTGWSVSDVRWTGVRLRDVLAAAGLRPQGKVLRFVSAETPYVDSLTLEQADFDDVMLAYGMDGRTLTRPHGAPVRVVLPRMYGYKGVKWLKRIEVVDRYEDGYWEQRGYDRDGWLHDDHGL